MEQIKREFFQDDPDEPIIFHRKEMVNNWTLDKSALTHYRL